MALTLEVLLTRLRADHDLDLAAVVSDGAVVSVDAISGIDVDTVCNTVGDLVLLNATLGAEIDRGSIRVNLIEYERGAVVVTPLRTGEDLVLLSSDTTNLGRIRLAARRFYDAYSGYAVRA
jgi:predicted regulator of Ras-like GTPase activity (Roadblock/LC7/MglB family)